MKIITKIAVLLLMSITTIGMAQNTNIRMVVRDTATKENLSFAAAAVLNAVDSQLVLVNYTADDGSVLLSGLKSGDYYVSVSYLSYNTFVKKITITTADANKTLDWGTIAMQKKAIVLSDVTVKADVVAVAIKNDTIEYNSAAFKTRPNASTEELLKKLPGVQVEKDGTIKAQGETVNKVLVDGKPFFGDDPKMATKNLPADAIDKIQVYDQKSEQSQFTGINDGTLGKTIDLKLKADKKKGKFGKIIGGYGTDDRFRASLSYNRFKPNQKISILSTANNVNSSNFTLQDVYSDLGRGSANINTNDDGKSSLLGSQKTGINTVYYAGGNFSTELNKGKTSLTGSYSYNQNIQKMVTSSNRAYLLSDLRQAEESSSEDNRKTQQLNLEIEHKFDKRNSIKLTPSLSYQEKNTNSHQKTVANVGERSVSEQVRDVISKTTSYSIKGNAIYRHKFAKEGRTFSLSSNFNLGSGSGTSDYNISLQDTLNSNKYLQIWQNSSDNYSIPVTVSYTEPLSKKWKLETSYLFYKSTNKSLRDASILRAGENVFVADPTVSAHLTSDGKQQRATARLQYEKLRYTLTFEGAYENYQRDNNSALNQQNIAQTFNYFLPTVRLQYSLPKKMRWGLNYTTNINYPSISQLITNPDNSNPLRVQKGNIELLPTYTHGFNANFSKADIQRNRFVHFYSRFSLPQNAFSTATTLDKTTGRQTSQTINVAGNYNFSSSLGVGFPIQKFKFRVDGNASSNKRNAIINALTSSTYSNGLGSNLSINYDPNDYVDISVQSGLNYTQGKNTTNAAQNTNYYNWDSSVEGTFQLSWGVELSSDISWVRYYGLSSGFNRNYAIWNASIAKSVLKDNRLELRLTAFDILKQNQNINRTISAQYIEDERNVNLTQYFMFQATYFLNKAGRPESKNGRDGMRMMFGGRGKS